MEKSSNNQIVGSSPNMEMASSDPTVGSSPNMEKTAIDATTAENDPTAAASDPTAASSDPTAAVNDPTTTSVSRPKDTSEENSGAMKILRCIVDNQKYPITLKTFHKLFSRFGKIKKIVLFTKNRQLQALIEFQDSSTAQKALIALDNKNIYDGCCYMRIDYSNIQETLKVLFNNDKTWDFTRPDLPSSGPGETTDERVQDIPQQSQPNFSGGNYRGGGSRGKGDMGYETGNMRGQSQYSGRGMDRSLRTMGRNRGHVGRRNHPYEREGMKQRGMADMEHGAGYNRGPMGNSGRAMHRPRGHMGEPHRGMRGMGGRPMTNMDHGVPGRGSWRGNMRGHYRGGMDSAGSGPWY